MDPGQPDTLKQALMRERGMEKHTVHLCPNRFSNATWKPSKLLAAPFTKSTRQIYSAPSW